MYKVPISVLKECKDLLKSLTKVSTLDSFFKKKKKADKLIKLLEDNYYV